MRRAALAAGLAVALAAWWFREPLKNRLEQQAILSNDAPSEEMMDEVIQKSSNPAAALVAAWNSGKIIHREAAMRQIGNMFKAEQPLPPELESIVRAGALDADMDVRESALGILQDRNDPALEPLAAAQLQDCDPEARTLGLNYLKRAKASVGVPLIIPLLDDADPFIVSMSLNLLENWSGENFGVKLVDTAAVENEKTGLKEFRDSSREMAKVGAARAKVWWAAHKAEFPQHGAIAQREIIVAPKRVSAGDFSLRALDGRQVRLSELRGKVVLINFWTTWCTACVSELPELIALQKEHGDTLAILGVSLDFVPNEDICPPQSEKGLDAAGAQKVREKVARTVKARGINYTVLLDEANAVGGRFNGGELPTTVLVDAQGKVRRRFIGARSLAVFEAMIAEAGRPLDVASR